MTDPSRLLLGAKPNDVETIRRDLGRAGRGWQIVLRELQTLSGHPNRLHE
jgi:hypothetical protein